MRVFLDTNVLAGAFGTRGVCADLLRLILQKHELVIGEVVLEELRSVLRRKFRLQTEHVGGIERFLRGYQLHPKPGELPNLRLRDRADLIVVASALESGAEILITGDQELLALRTELKGMRIVSPREFWNLTSGKPAG